MLEFGTSMPISGENSASNAITASEYLLEAAGVDSTTWKERGLAISAVSFAVITHAVAPRVGRALQDVLSAVKLFILFFIVCTGFAALGGHLRVPKPDNLSASVSFKGTSSSGYNIGTALLDCIFSYQGYDNLNAFAGVSREDFLGSNITIAATLFRNVYGESAGVKALPALVALSAIGHLLSVAFAVSRLIQELAKDGTTPFPDLLMQNRPFKTPILALAVHLSVTIIFICAPPAGSAFDFVVDLGTYPTVFLLSIITIGLIKLRLSKTDDFYSSFKVPWAALVFYLAANIVCLPTAIL
ncbi:hypothetical protein N7528_001691 [Penicillium herquei]|nr:hypothetical protein N7528_001691 [Penicillium herquei]